MTHPWREAHFHKAAGAFAPKSPSTTPAPAFDLAAARLAWSADEETRLDLRSLAGDALKAMHGFGSGGNRWVRDHFARLAELDPAALAAESWINPSRALEILNFIRPDAGPGPLHGARRRWPQALALAGVWEFSQGPDLVFEQAVQVAATWILSTHPEFRQTPSSMTTPEAAALVDQGRRETCAQAIDALFSFGEQLGVADPLQPLQKAAAKTLFHRGARVGSKATKDCANELASYLESLWLARAAPAPASPARPRARI